MRVVGVDQSYTGFGYSVDGDSKKRAFPSSRYDSDTHRLAAIEDWWSQWLGVQIHAGIDLVVMEGYANAAKFGREVAGELGAVVKLATLAVVGHPPLVVPPTSLKKFVTGKGNAKKNEMLLGVYKKWGVEFSDDNQADAYALEAFGQVYLALRDDETWARSGVYPKYEIEAVEAVLHPK